MLQQTQGKELLQGDLAKAKASPVSCLCAPSGVEPLTSRFLVVVHRNVQ